MSPTPAVLLISPGILKWTDMDFGLPHLVSLGGYLRAHTGVRVEILDLNYEGGDHRTLERRLDDLGPFVLIGISAYSSYDLQRSLALARFLRGLYPDVPMITGGYHASALPGDVVFDGSPFDAVVRGEGERPVAALVKTLLGGGRLESRVLGPDVVPVLDDLPPYAWDLLDHYWPRARDIGRKLQVYLSRGCPYHCTFCMERSKSGYSWRSFSPQRALDELSRLATFTDLSHWVVNLADPLFGFHRRWRREVLQGIVDRGLRPRQYWTLTRSDDLDDEDVRLLAAARFSIGIGMESGSPRMLRIMQKGNHPDTYLANMRRLASLSRRHGLNWAANIIVGHPGETPETMRETHAFLTALYTEAADTCGWLSIDPFRLYPGSAVHEQQAQWAADHGAVFHHPEWWKTWYDGPFLAQHLEPSSELSYADRVRFMFDAYGPLIGEVQRRFRGQGRSVDRVFERSLAEQRALLSPQRRDALVAQGERALRRVHATGPSVDLPLGMNVRDPAIRRREEAVRRLLDHGVLRTGALVEALLQVPPGRFMGADDARAVLEDRMPEVAQEGLLPPALPVRLVAMGLEALEPAAGDTVADLTATSGWVSALLAELVGAEGRVLAAHPCRADTAMRRSVAGWPNIEVLPYDPARQVPVLGPLDGAWLGAAVPRLPRAVQQALRDPGGRAVTFVGPRFRPQDLVSLTRRSGALDERLVARHLVPVLGGHGGWVRAVQAVQAVGVRVEAWRAPALGFHVLAHLDLGPDAAALYDPGLPRPPWHDELARAWHGAAGRIHLQAMCLSHHEPDALLHALRHHAPDPLADPAGQHLCQCFAAALAAARPAFEARWSQRAAQEAARAGAAELVAPLDQLRRHLWVQRGEAPPLVVLDVPALGPRARAASTPAGRRVATSLAEGTDHALLQILHEEVHPLTDPVVLAEARGDRDTRPGTAGWPVHAELERVAVAATEAFLAARAPQYTPAFRRWVARHR